MKLENKNKPFMALWKSAICSSKKFLTKNWKTGLFYREFFFKELEK